MPRPPGGAQRPPGSGRFRQATRRAPGASDERLCLTPTHDLYSFGFCVFVCCFLSSEFISPPHSLLSLLEKLCGLPAARRA